METPKNNMLQRPARKPTPRLSERKKSLFNNGKMEIGAGDDILQGITPLDKQLDELSSDSHANVLKIKPSGYDAKDVEKDNKHKARGSRRSLQLNEMERISKSMSDKENQVLAASLRDRTEDQLPVLFSASMRLSGNESPKCGIRNSNTIDEAPSLVNVEQNLRTILKRPHDETYSDGTEIQCKVTKTESNALSISAKSFYSNPYHTIKSTSKMLIPPHSASHSRNFSPPTRRQERRQGQLNINKGVRHKIRRRIRPAPTPVRNATSLDVDAILSNVHNDKLKKRIASKREEKAQIEKVHKIFRTCKDPIAMAQPLKALSDSKFAYNNNNNDEIKKTTEEPEHVYFSDIDYESDENSFTDVFNEEIIPIINHKDIQPLDDLSTTDGKSTNASISKRKFFKSGRATSTRMEVKITDNIRASVCNGRLKLLQEKKQKRRRNNNNSVNGFFEEQATVDEILKSLDDSGLKGDMHVEEPNENNNKFDGMQSQSIAMPGDNMFFYSEFRKRIPYKTCDPDIIQQQNLLLDFLISNNICNERNFTIFIADPDNHKEEASRIVDEIFMVINETTDMESTKETFSSKNADTNLITQQQICLQTIDKSAIRANDTINTVTVEESMPESHLNESNTRIANNVELPDGICNNADEPVSVQSNQKNSNQPEKLFPIFYAGQCQPLVKPLVRRVNRSWCGGQGANQYQIDAGQKNFGAQQCKQCGLVYSVHEPEEEQLHREYHASLHVLRFKGWIDEDTVAICREWSIDGRIIRITDSSAIKRRERLLEILKIVDNELGFSSYIIPKTFVAFLAVRKSHIVGLCLVQPLEKANRYLCVNGVDCCTQEEFEARCGISRIWVSPLHRRLRIASKLIETVQSHTIPGGKVELEKIAFSAPTDVGKLLAQKVMNTENFLVYQ